MVNERIPKLDLSAMVHAPAWDRVAKDYTEVIASHLERYAAEALALAQLSPGERAVDVATGPGTLARLAARVTRVAALDFSSSMLKALEERVTPEERGHLELRQGDGQALPYEPASFDAAFSMFGLFMFPDRSRGFSELHRVLRPGGRAVVGTWQVQDSIQPFMIINAALAEESGEVSAGPPPLSDPGELRAEIEAAGFTGVEVRPVTHTFESPSTEVLWYGLERAHVALGIARDQLSPADYAQLSGRIRQQLDAELGAGPQQLAMPAWLALGRVA